jgi:prepilin-type N-terminal cleavage/methylation domain-containing protein
MSVVRRTPKGFTLVELMVVVAIIGILASVALPSFQRYTLRAKASERVYVFKEIKRGVEDYWTLNGTFPRVSGSTSSIYCSYNPAYPPTTNRRPMQFRAWDDWGVLNLQIEGGLYGSYYVSGSATTASSFYYPYMFSNIDGDANLYNAYQFRVLNQGVWQDSTSYPPPGSPEANYF